MARSTLKQRIADEGGAALVEYSLLIASLALVVSMSVASAGSRSAQTFARAGLGMSNRSNLQVIDAPNMLGGGGFGIDLQQLGGW